MNQPKTDPLIEIPIAHNGLGYVCSAYMLNLIRAASESGIRVQFTEAGDSLANRACNRITNDFMAGNADELWIVDTDIVTCGQHFKWLGEHDVELVYGTYSKRQPLIEHCLAVLNNGDRPTPGQLWEVRRAGRGYTRIKRSLLERMKEENGGPALRYHNGKYPVEWDFWPTGVHSGKDSTAGEGNDKDGFPLREFYSEDWGFCDRARNMGVPILVDTRIQTKHIGQWPFPIDYTEEMLPQILAAFSDGTIRRTWSKVKQMRAPRLHWEAIHGWCDDCNDALFCWLVDRIPDGGKYVEVGCWLGRGTACFGARMREAEKDIQLNVVDTFNGSQHEPCLSVQAQVISDLRQRAPITEDGNFREVFAENMRGTMTPAVVHEGTSAEMAKHFDDNSLDAVYIDAGHTFEEVQADIVTWLAKVKPGGVLCGDDYGIDFKGVTEAVNQTFEKEKVRQQGRVWIYEVPA